MHSRRDFCQILFVVVVVFEIEHWNISCWFIIWMLLWVSHDALLCDDDYCHRDHQSHRTPVLYLLRSLSNSLLLLLLLLLFLIGLDEFDCILIVSEIVSTSFCCRPVFEFQSTGFIHFANNRQNRCAHHHVRGKYD